MRNFTTASLLIIALLPSNLQAQKLISYKDALKHDGDFVRIEMKVDHMGRGGTALVLASEGKLRVNISKECQDVYIKQGTTAKNYFRHQRVEVTGKIRLATTKNGTIPVIDVASTDAIKILGPDAKPRPEKTMKAGTRPSSAAGKPKSESNSSLPKVSELVNRRVDLYLRDGRIIGGAKITALEVGDVPDSFVSLKAEIGGTRPRTFQARTLTDIAVDGTRLSLKYNRDENALIVDLEARQQLEREVLENQIRLRATGKKLWDRLTEDEHAEWNRQHRDFTAKIQQEYPLLPLRVVETTYFLIVTDIAESEVNTYLRYLDKLYTEMCRAFGVPEGYNIWCGKCVVVAFKNRPDFIRFEVEMMKNTGNARESSGLCHSQTSGRVVISLFKKDLTDRFATALVQLTSHGMVARFRSDARLPSWLSEGMAVWIAEYIVPQDSTLEENQRASVAALQAQQTLAGFFEAENTADDLYGCASAIVGILLEVDKNKFRQFVTDIKLGYTQESSLMKNYDLTFDDVTKEYGRRIGLPELRK